MKKILSALLFFCLIICTPLVYADTIDSLFTLYEHANNNNKNALRQQLFTAFLDNEYIDSTDIRNLKKTQKDWDKLIYYGMAQHACYDNEYQKAINYALESLQNTPKDSIGQQVNVYDFLVIAHSRIGNLDKAIEYLQKTYQIDMIRKDEEGMSTSLNNLAALYLQNNQPEEAEKYIIKAIETERKLHRDKQLAIRLGMQSDILLQLGKTDEAYKSVKEALELDSKGKRDDKIAIRQSQMGEVLMRQNKYAEAQQYCTKALSYFEKAGMTNSTIICLRQLAQIALHNNDKEKATSLLLRSEKLCKTSNSNYLLQKIYYQLYDINKSGNPAQALRYLEYYNALQDSIYSIEKQKELANFQVKYDTQEKEYRIEEQRIELHRNKIQLILILSILGLTSVLIVVTFILLRIKSVRNRELTAINETKDKFFSIISHDLKNPIIAQKKIMDVLDDQFDNITQQEMKEYIAVTRQSVNNQYNLVMELLEWARIETGNFPYSPICLDLNKVINDEKQLLQNLISQKELTFLLTAQQPVTLVYGDKIMTETVVRNLLSNAIKFSHPHGEIEISIVEDGSKYIVSVIDHGVGIRQDRIKQLFTVSNRSTTGTMGEKGTGLGLKICKELIENNKGTLTVKSTEGSGAVFSFTIEKYTDKSSLS